MDKMIAILKGDGIGPEIINEGVKILDIISQIYNHKFYCKYAEFGASAYFKEGSPFPENTKKICDDADAIVKGPVGLNVADMNKIPQKFRPEVGAILPLRERYETYVNYRPVYLPKELSDYSPLKKEVIGDGIDIMMIRELVGGIYFGEKIEGGDTGMQYASDNCVYKRHEVQRIAHAAFKEARLKNRMLTNVHKANILATSRFWCSIVDDIAGEYPDVEYRTMLVDNVAFQLVKNPVQFNGVVLLENMQGDIITDLAGGVIGSLGLMPSACVGPKKGYVEASHGSAPDIAGKNIANPYSMIGSFAFLLEKLFGLKEEADVIWEALINILKEGCVTADLASKNTIKENILNTSRFGDKVKEYIIKKYSS